MTLEAIASAIYNSVVGGLTGISSNPKISIEQIKDEAVAERHQVLREFLLKGVIKIDELMKTINCIQVSCDYISKCCDAQVGDKAMHFEIPPVMVFPGEKTIKYIGSIDNNTEYTIYMDQSYKYNNLRRRKSQRPYVFVDTAINSNGNMDCYIYNAPFVKAVKVVALFNDPRKLLEWDCCSADKDVIMDFGLISDEVIKRMVEKYVRWFRQFQSTVLPNNQQPK